MRKDARYTLGTLVVETAGVVNLKNHLDLDVQPWMMNMMVCIGSNLLAIANNEHILIVQIPGEAKMHNVEDAQRRFRIVHQLQYCGRITNLQKKVINGQEFLLACCWDAWVYVFGNVDTDKPFRMGKDCQLNESVWGADLYEGKLCVSSNTHWGYIFEPMQSQRYSTALSGHQHNIPCVAYSPQGRYLATACIDQCLRLYDVTGEYPKGRMFELKGDSGWGVGFILREDIEWEVRGVDYSHFHMQFTPEVEHLDAMNLSVTVPSYYWDDWGDGVGGELVFTGTDLNTDATSESDAIDESESELQSESNDENEATGDSGEEPSDDNEITSLNSDSNNESESNAIEETETDELQESEEQLGESSNEDESRYSIEPSDDNESEHYSENMSTNSELENEEPVSRGAIDESDAVSPGSDELRSEDDTDNQESQSDLHKYSDNLSLNEKFELKEADHYVFYLSSRNLHIYKLSELCSVGTPQAELSLHRILLTSVSPDQRALFHNGSLHWEHERYVFAKYVPDLSCLFLANQLGFVTILLLRKRVEDDGGIYLMTMSLTLPMGDDDVSPLVGMDVCRVDPDNPTFHKLYMLHLDGTLRTYLIRKVIKPK